MKTYKIEYQITTLLENSLLKDGKPTHFDRMGIKFEQWDFNYTEGWIGDKWICTKTIDAENWIKAINSFRNNLKIVIPRFALIGQCYIDYLNQPFLITKDDIGVFNYIKDSSPVPLNISENSLKALDILIENDDIPNAFFYYWKEATNTIGYSSKLLLMFSAIESLITKNNKTDYNKLKNILGEELKKELWGEKGNSNNSIRNRLVHGEHFDSKFSNKRNFVEEIHKKVINYFNQNVFKEYLIEDVVGPQRNFYDNINRATWMIKNKENKAMNLKNVLDDFKNGWQDKDLKQHKHTTTQELWDNF